MATLYVIPNWERDFENADSRRIGHVTWFAVQNHFDGKRMRRLLKLKNPAELYGIFHAICAIASKCWYRGVLLDDSGPINALDLSDKTGFSVKNFARALEQLSDPLIGLLERHEIEEIDGKWELPEAVKAWAKPRTGRQSSRRGGISDEPAPTGQERTEPAPTSANRAGTGRTSANRA